MSLPESERGPLPPWYWSMLSATHLQFGPGVSPPGPLEQALVRATEESLAGLEESPEETRLREVLFRSYPDPDEALTARHMLGTVLERIAGDPTMEALRRDASLLALALLVVLEDRHPDVLRRRSSPGIGRIAGNMQRYVKTSAGLVPRPPGRGCRPKLLQLLQASGSLFDPEVHEMAQDIADRVKPGSDMHAFVAECLDLLPSRSSLRRRRMPPAVEREPRPVRDPEPHKPAPLVGLDDAGFLTYNGSRWVRARVGARRDVPVGRPSRSKSARYLAKLLYFLEQGINARESDRYCKESYVASDLRRACEEAGSEIAIEGRTPYFAAKGRVRLTPELRSAVAAKLPPHSHKR